MRLKISQYAKIEGVKYRAIWNRIKKEQLQIEKTPTGRIYIIIDEEKEKKRGQQFIAECLQLKTRIILKDKKKDC
jgi:hypothetical protein